MDTRKMLEQQVEILAQVNRKLNELNYRSFKSSEWLKITAVQKGLNNITNDLYDRITPHIEPDQTDKKEGEK